MKTLRIIGLPFVQLERPITRLENTVIPKPSKAGYHSAIFLTLVYLSIFVAGWNYSFTTYAEKIAWRVSSLAVIGCTRRFPSLQRDGAIRPLLRAQRRANASRNTAVRAFHRFIAGLQNNDIAQDPDFDLPVPVILSLYIAGSIYVFGRTCILIEDIIERRSLPASAYMTVEWSAVLPHFE
ncbi:hypothetical protein VTO42DRAFT_7224 [Malbranchea cinnamomea]